MSDLESKAQQVETWLLGGNYQDVLIARLRRIIEQGSPDPMRVMREIGLLEGVRVDQMQLDRNSDSDLTNNPTKLYKADSDIRHHTESDSPTVASRAGCHVLWLAIVGRASPRRRRALMPQPQTRSLSLAVPPPG